MRKCPNCGRVFDDDKLIYCMNDGGVLVNYAKSPPPTVQYSGSLGRQPLSAPPTPPSAKKNNSLWVLGGVAALMLVLFIGVIMIVGLVISFKNSANNADTANKNARPTPVTLVAGSEKIRPELKMAINSANAAQSAAYATYNTDALRDYYSGEALKAFLADVEMLKKNNIYQVSTMREQEFQDFKLNQTADEAEVRVVETWETRIYQTPSRKCLAYHPPRKMPQTVYLKKSPRGWMIDANIHENKTPAEPQPCPKKK